jgi:glucokinase
MRNVILAGDIGGTKTHLALYERGSTPRRPLREITAASRDFPSLEAILRRFLAEGEAAVTRTVLGIAGPVVGNRVEATNLPWIMDGAAIGTAIGCPSVTLINDLEATAWGLGLLGERDLEVVQPGDRVAGNRALIAAGTGLGEAILVRDGERWLPSASEGGHVDFGARDPVEDELSRWLRAKHGRVSYERVLSGPGLAELYRFMSETRRGAEPAGIARRFADAGDPAAVVTETGLDGSCERARLTLEKWVEIYGAEAGNLALKALAVGGVYVGGGIAPRMLPMFRAGHFLRGFATKGRLSPVLARIPVAIILDAQTALWGAAQRALLPD